PSAVSAAFGEKFSHERPLLRSRSDYSWSAHFASRGRDRNGERYHHSLSSHLGFSTPTRPVRSGLSCAATRPHTWESNSNARAPCPFSPGERGGTGPVRR